MEVKDKMKERVQRILRDADIAGDTVVLTGMMKQWLVNLFAGKIHSDKCYIITIIDTSAVNCNISSNEV